MAPLWPSWEEKELYSLEFRALEPRLETCIPNHILFSFCPTTDINHLAMTLVGEPSRVVRTRGELRRSADQRGGRARRSRMSRRRMSCRRMSRRRSTLQKIPITSRRQGDEENEERMKRRRTARRRRSYIN